MREDRDPVGIILVSLVFFMLYLFGVFSLREKNELSKRNETSKYKKPNTEGYIEHEESSKF